MRAIIIIFCFFSFSVLGQTGPGGAGNSTNNILWYSASEESFTDGDAVSTITDFSGNGNDATQLTPGSEPTFITSGINGQPTFRFDGIDNYLDIGSDISTTGISAFVVFNSNNSGINGIFSFNRHNLLINNSSTVSVYETPRVNVGVSFTLNDLTVYQMHTGSTVASSSFTGIRSNSAGNSNIKSTRTTLLNRPSSYIGVLANSAGTLNRFFDGDISEVIVFNEEIHLANRRLVNSYLAGKYNISGLSNFYSPFATHGHEVVGIARELTGSVSTARGNGNIEISNPTSLGNGDYLLIGNDNAGYAVSTSVPSGIGERWTQVWRSDVTGTPGDVDLEFFLDGNDLTGSTSEYVLLIDDDGDFSNGGTTQNTSGTFSMGDQSVTFSGITLSSTDFFTLAIEDNTVEADSDGDWDDAGTWDCACIPDETNDVIIGSPFEVTIDANARVNNLTIDIGGELIFGTNDTLDIEGDFTLAGTLTTSSMGTIAMTGITDQTITNSSMTLTDLNNFFINNPSFVSIESGPWSISNNLQVSSGVLDVSGADSIVLLSSSSKTSQILESVDNGFLGTFKVERHISNRSNNYANISSTVESATVADLDDDLFLSGVGGNNGNAAASGGGTFFSVFRFDRPTDAAVAITSTATALTSGEGYEVYLGTTATMFTDEGFSLEGIPNTGTVSTSIDQGFNLVGNPYHSFIDFDEMDKSSIDDVYYIFNSSTGVYSTFFGLAKPPIAAGQGFWVEKSTVGSVSFDFEESHKTSNTSSAFVRKKQDEAILLKLKEANGQERNQLSLEFNSQSTNDFNSRDIRHLPSPFKHIPEITTKANNSTVDLVRNSLSVFDNVQQIPINVKAEEGKELKIVSENFDAVYDNYSCAYLKDNSTGKVTDMMVESEVAFTADNNLNRFSLILSNSYDDCQKSLENETITQEIDRTLSLRNMDGSWYLNFNLSDEIQNLTIALYNMNGQLVSENKTITVSGEGNFQLNNLNPKPGIYLIQVKGKDLFLNKSIKF